MKKSIFYRFIKRSLDISVSSLLLVVLAPVLVLVSVLIKASDRGCVFYMQPRIGQSEKVFTLYKFRSMTDVQRVSHKQVNTGDPDVTGIGHFIRRFKIDELPQLWNVLKGDLSLVGPRPCLPVTLIDFGRSSKLRHSIRPGLTGLAQVNGNVNLSWRNRLRHDCLYVKRQSLILDLKILSKTVLIILLGEAWGRRN